MIIIYYYQEEWQRMGFRGDFQGTGQFQDALQQRYHNLDAGQGLLHTRCSPFCTLLRVLSIYCQLSQRLSLLCRYITFISSIISLSLLYC